MCSPADHGSNRSPRRSAGRVRKLAVAVTACTVVPLTLLWVFQDRFLYISEPVPPVHDVLPGAESVDYPSTDGVEVHGWLVPAKAPRRGVTAVVLHGQYGNRAIMAGFGHDLAGRGVDVLLAEYRGYGDVPGTPNEPNLVDDAVAARRFAATDPRLAGNRVVYVGHSLGTGVALGAQQAVPADGVVLLAPFTSLPAVAWSRLPGIPYDWLMRDRFDSRARIATVPAPTLIIGGVHDSAVPAEHAPALAAAAAGPVTIEMLEADHDLVTLDGVSLAGRVDEWLRRAVG